MKQAKIRFCARFIEPMLALALKELPTRAPVFYAFDLPIVSGEDLMKRSLDERRKALHRLTRLRP